MRITSFFFFFTRFSIWWFYFSIRVNPPGSTRKPMLTHHGRGGEVNGPIKFAFWNPGSAVLITFTLLEMCETMAWRHNIQEFRTRIGFMSNDAAVGTWPLRLRLRAKFIGHSRRTKVTVESHINLNTFLKNLFFTFVSFFNSFVFLVCLFVCFCFCFNLFPLFKPLREPLKSWLVFKNHGINVWSGSDEQNSEQKHYPGHGFCVSTRARSVDSTTT